MPVSGTAPPYGQGTGYGDTSVVADVSRFIFQLTPEDTPYFDLIGDSPANPQNVIYHQWQRRELVTRQDNAQPEGFVYTFTNPSRLPVLDSNTLQILARDIRISESNQAQGHYGIDNMRADQVDVQLAELKTDIERALLRGTMSTGATGTARRLQGLIPMIQSNTTMQTNVSAATFSESRFNGFLEDGWNVGARLADVFVDGRMKRVISNFTGNATRIVNANDGVLVGAIDQYMSEFGPVTTHLCRDLPTFSTGTSLGRCVLAIDKTQIKKAWLRPVTIEKTAKIADSEDYILKCELSQEWGHRNGHYLYWNTASPI